MTDKEKLMQILNVAIFPHVDADPLEVVADYLLGNDVVPVVRCKDCAWAKKPELDTGEDLLFCENRNINNCKFRNRKDFCSFGMRKTNG